MACDPEILLVDDNPDDIAIAERAFRRRHLDQKLAIARDAGEALAFLGQDGNAPASPTSMVRLLRPKVILLDLNLPGRDGRELLKRLRADERTRHVPIVMVSTSASREDIESCYRLGANGYTVKQYSEDRPGHYLVDVALYWLTLNRIP